MDHKEARPDDASNPGGGKSQTKTQTETPEAGGPHSPAAAQPKQDAPGKHENNRKGGYGAG